VITLLINPKVAITSSMASVETDEERVLLWIKQRIPKTVNYSDGSVMRYRWYERSGCEGQSRDSSDDETEKLSSWKR
jgi:hypothetical protein